MSRTHRYELLFILLFAVPIGGMMAGDAIKRYKTAGMTLTTGQVIREMPRNGLRPVVEIRIDNSPVTVQARLSMDTVETIPKSVSFYFDGDPASEVHLREETNPLWFIVLCVGLPIGLLAWDFFSRARKKGVAKSGTIRGRNRVAGTGNRLGYPVTRHCDHVDVEGRRS